LAGAAKKRRNKELKFVEPGTYIHRAERKRSKAENAAKSGFLSGRKQGQFLKSAGIANVVPSSDGNYYGRSAADGDASALSNVSTLAKHVPRADAVGESLDGSSKSTGGVVVIPAPLVMEWWDLEYLPSKLKKEVVAMEGKAVAMKASQRMKFLKSGDDNGVGTKGPTEQEKKDELEKQALIQRCFEQANIQNSKTWKLIQHPVPVIPPNAPKQAKAPTLHLTKKEMKRQRKLRRAEKQRELQDMQAAGLIPAPDAKLTLSNFMRVLGDQAVLDPSKMEAKVMEQIQARKLKHERMNAERKLTKEQRAEKRERKLTEDTSASVSVALFLVKDMSHRYHRTKVDLNAQQNKITGGVLECEVPKLSLVICEGGPKAVKRYIRLMTVRMKWKGEGVLDVEESDDDETAGMDGEEGGAKQKPQKVCYF
jgi:U4/U6 small nuclear ribonucleoprotein PRP3